MNYTFRPLQWAGPITPAEQRRSRWAFRAGWSDTLRLLEDELWRLDADRVVVEADFRERDLRRDGMPRADARQPEFPGVRIAFDSKHGPLVYATDAYEFWQHNVRAVALSLEALRAVDRYGVTKRAEQYTGWRAIGVGPATPMDTGPMTEAQARDLLLALVGVPNGDNSDLALYRRAVKIAHPDQGGSRAVWDQVQEARKALGL